MDYLKVNHPEIEVIFSFQMPTYVLGKGKHRNYIAFSANKGYFTIHSLDFEYIDILIEKLSRPDKGKGCVRIAFTNDQEKQILKQAVDDIIERHRMKMKNLGNNL